MASSAPRGGRARRRAWALPWVPLLLAAAVPWLGRAFSGGLPARPVVRGTWAARRAVQAEVEQKESTQLDGLAADAPQELSEAPAEVDSADSAAPAAAERPGATQKQVDDWWGYAKADPVFKFKWVEHLRRQRGLDGAQRKELEEFPVSAPRAVMEGFLQQMAPYSPAWEATAKEVRNLWARERMTAFRWRRFCYLNGYSNFTILAQAPAQFMLDFLDHCDDLAEDPDEPTATATDAQIWAVEHLFRLDYRARRRFQEHVHKHAYGITKLSILPRDILEDFLAHSPRITVAQVAAAESLARVLQVMPQAEVWWHKYCESHGYDDARLLAEIPAELMVRFIEEEAPPQKMRLAKRMGANPWQVRRLMSLVQRSPEAKAAWEEFCKEHVFGITVPGIVPHEQMSEFLARYED